MFRLLTKSRDILYLTYGLIFSLLTIFFTSNLRILNPSYTGWLTQGDGISEISWEFFRHQPIFQFPLGLNPKYGLEISSTIAFDGQIPLFSLILHPFSPFLPERFQYIGIFILITFLLNYFFSAKIFNFLKMNEIQIILNSLILSSSPIILNRFIEHTHYSLTSAWLILWAIYLCLENKEFNYQWFFVLNLSALIHFYYIFFVFGLYFINLTYQVFKKKVTYSNFLIQNFFIILTLLVNMFVVGFFYGEIESESIGYGLYKSSLTSLLDPSGWSIFIRDIPELDGAYEGFSYLGVASIFLILVYIFALIIRKNSDKIHNLNFAPIWITSLILFVYSFSNKLAFGKYEILQFAIPSQLNILTNTFRSTGRFTWLLVLFLFIFISYKIFLTFNRRTYTFLLIISLTLLIIDSSKQLVSEKENKFIAKDKTDLINPAWQVINECYQNLRVYPPVASVENVYNFTNLSQKLNIGINTGRLGRLSTTSQNIALTNMHSKFKSGDFDSDSFYVFTSSEFVPIDFVNYYKNIALRTINDTTSWGILDNYTFIAPNLAKCQFGEKIKKISTGFGPSKSYIYKGGVLEFGNEKISDNYVITAAKIDRNGIIPQDDTFNLMLVIDKKFKPINFKIVGKQINAIKNNRSYGVYFNEKLVNNCIFLSELTPCEIQTKEMNSYNQILNISLKPNTSSTQNEYKEVLISQIEFN